MLSLDVIRKNPDKVRAACRDKNTDVDVDAILELDAQHRSSLHALEEMRSGHNAASKSIAAKKKAGEDLAESFQLL